jgi:GTP cyclohydrolase I
LLQHEIPGCAEDLLKFATGLDVTTVHGKDTPRRFVSMLDDLTNHRECDTTCIKWKAFDSPSDEMIVVKDIPFYSVCNHHVIPFYGKAWIGYVPDARIAGLSKFARVVNHFARRLQVQEELTAQVHNYIHLNLMTKGLMVVLEGEHLCMTLRGAQVPGTTTRTVKTSGVFADHAKTAKMEFLEAIR